MESSKSELLKLSTVKWYWDNADLLTDEELAWVAEMYPEYFDVKFEELKFDIDGWLNEIGENG